jgi:hypothetical protein
LIECRRQSGPQIQVTLAQPSPASADMLPRPLESLNDLPANGASSFRSSARDVAFRIEGKLGSDTPDVMESPPELQVATMSNANRNSNPYDLASSNMQIIGQSLGPDRPSSPGTGRVHTTCGAMSKRETGAHKTREDRLKPYPNLKLTCVNAMQLGERPCSPGLTASSSSLSLQPPEEEGCSCAVLSVCPKANSCRARTSCCDCATELIAKAKAMGEAKETCHICSRRRYCTRRSKGLS